MHASPLQSPTTPNGQVVRVGNVRELFNATTTTTMSSHSHHQQRSSRHALVQGPNGDTVLIVSVDDGSVIPTTKDALNLRAVAASCHHMGHSLAGGDIEDIGQGRHAIVCPAHRRRIDLDSGACVDYDLNGRVRVCAERAQRVYPLRVDDMGDVWVNFARDTDSQHQHMQGVAYASDVFTTPPPQPQPGPGRNNIEQLNMLSFRQRKKRSQDAIKRKMGWLDEPKQMLGEVSVVDTDMVPPSPDASASPSTSSKAAKLMQQEGRRAPSPLNGNNSKRPSVQRTLTDMFDRIANE